MILQALTAYYEQLLRTGQIAAPGWDHSFKVSYWLRIGPDGQLLDLVDCRQRVPKGKKEVLAPREMPVPAHVKRSSGIAANFLCDNSTYLLGADEKGKPERSRQCFEACAALHHKLLDGVDSPVARAILAFLDTWKPENAPSHPLLAPCWKDLTNNANLLFDYEGPEGRILANEDEAIQNAWQQYYSSRTPADAATVQCLVTGKQAPAEKTHPSIKGVKDAQSSGAALVSFNAPAFCSYGHEQGENAPVSEYAAFAYTTALNKLLADRDHCRILGDTTVVCWAENASPGYASLGMMGMFGVPEDAGVTEDDLRKALELLADGRPCPWLNQEMLQPGQHFYILGLSPNAARISVRFFLRDTFEVFAQRLQRYADETEIVRPANDKWAALPIWALVRETVNQNARDKKPSPQLAGDLLRSVLTGGRYPATLLNGAVLRIRAEQSVTRGRAAILKAYYLRNEPTDINKEVFTVSLNESTNVPYILGRLFSVLETLQEAANGTSTIRARYFNSACATPALVFPTLLKLAQKHLQKIGGGLAVSYSQQITGLMALVPDDGFPARLSLPDQGKFEIGYYHQTQKRYTKKNEEE